MKVLVTGGCGFIGSNFLNLFVKEHPEMEFLNVDALTYAGNPLSLSGIEGASNYRFVHQDLAVFDGCLRVVEGFEPDMVVHFAAESHVDRSIKGPRAFLDSNVVATFNLLESCRFVWGSDLGGKVFHHVSTDEVYGELGDEGRFTEETSYSPSSPYSASKAASDHYVRAWGRTYDLPVKITNCSNNYGPYQFPEKLIPVMVLNALAGQSLPVYGTGANVRDWLFVDDHCRAVWEVATRGRVGETYNVGGNAERTNLEVVEAICDAVGARIGVGDLRKLITFVVDRPGHDFRYAIDASKIESELGWKPSVTFEEGLRRTVGWYLDNMEWVESVKSGEYLRWVAEHYGETS